MQELGPSPTAEQDPEAGRLRGLLLSPFMAGVAEAAGVFLFGFLMALTLLLVWWWAGGG